jgi:hypothetical protein
VTNTLAKYNATALHIFGVICPLLCVLSLLDYAGLLRWTWLVFLWMSCGHFVLYLYNVYPRLKHHAFATGLFVFGVGLLWPIWLLRHLREKEFWD